MNISRKKSEVQLGGPSTSYLSKIQANIKSPSRPTPPLPSRQLIESSHKIPHTKSPTKNSGSYQSITLSRERENNQSFTDLDSSKISTFSRNGDTRVLLGERINRPSPQKQIVNISYPSRNSSTSSRGPVKVIVSPTKIPMTTVSPREVQLERKLKIVEGRIGQLHREKQEAVSKLNQQNRKIYHENTSLKLKINDLTKIIERVESMKQSSKIDQPEQPHPKAIEFSNIKMENQNLKNEIQQLENYIASESQRCNHLFEQNQNLSLKIKELTEQHDRHIQQLSSVGQRFTSQLEDVQKNQRKILQLENQLQQYKENKQVEQKNQQNLKAQFKEQEERYMQRLEIYESKIKQYENAYNENQTLIRQLQDQVRALQCQEVKEEEENEESKLHEDLATECLNLQGMFTKAIQEKDEQIAKLRNENQQYLNKLNKMEAEVSQLYICDEDKTRKLDSASILLQKMTTKFEELSQRYTQLSERYQNEKGKMNKSEGFQTKCKKCDELLKTVVRLNNQLNPKKSHG